MVLRMLGFNLTGRFAATSAALERPSQDASFKHSRVERVRPERRLAIMLQELQEAKESNGQIGEAGLNKTESVPAAIDAIVRRVTSSRQL
jgi:hypothetical protein